MKNNVSAVYVQFKCVLEKVLVEFNMRHGELWQFSKYDVME